MAADGVSPSSLLPPRASATSGPATPLLSGLGSGGTGSGLSLAAAAFVPSTGLARPSSGSGGGLPLPLPLGPSGLGQLAGSGASGPASPAPAAAAAYGRLPDSIYGSESPTSSGGGSVTLGSRGGGLNVAAQPFTFGGSGGSSYGLPHTGSAGGSSAASPAGSSQLRAASAGPSPLSMSSLASGGGGGSSSLAPSAPSFSPALTTSNFGSRRSTPAGSPMVPGLGGGLSMLPAQQQGLGQQLPPPTFPAPRLQQQLAPRPAAGGAALASWPAGDAQAPASASSSAAQLPQGVDADSDGARCGCCGNWPCRPPCLLACALLLARHAMPCPPAGPSCNRCHPFLQQTMWATSARTLGA